VTSEITLTGRVALVTGATRGIGRAAALALGAAGAHVIAVGRTQGALEDLDDAIQAAGGERATLVPLDLTQGDGIDQLGFAIFQRHKRLDVLVHAAAMLGRLRPVAHISPALWDKLLATNVTSTYRLIRSLETLLRASEAGRAIFLTSGAAAHPRAFWGPYAATKAAVEAMVRSWADEIDSSPVRVALVNPGPMRTKMREEAFPGEDPDDLTHPDAIGPMIVELAAAPDLGPPTATLDFREWLSARSAAASGTP
jgi:NAD(P)-dependent dehydrogenase (short-subunit alcohol dehydrogenase family)